jgi:hypothetical protein
VSVELDAAWDVVVAKWDDQVAHDKLLALVAQSSSFRWAATQYKQRAGDPIADAQLERIRKAAIAMMFATASKKRETGSPYRLVIIAFIVLMIMLVLGLVGAKMLHSLHS